MKILYDHQIFSTQKWGGISRYFTELLKEYSKNDDIEYDLSLQYTGNHYLLENARLGSFEKDIYTDSFLKNINFKGKTTFYRLMGKIGLAKCPYVINERYSISKISKGNYDIFHPSYYDNYFIKYLEKKPFVLTVYDMMHEIYASNYFKLSKMFVEIKKNLIKRSTHIIAISENTKNDIKTMYGIEDNKITTVYLGNSLQAEHLRIEEPIVKGKYILYVGERSKYKNFENFIMSISSLLQKEKDLSVVCAGSVSFSKREIDFFEKMGLQNQISHKTINKDTILVNLYSNALCFVFPTLYEGFGIPVLEAFACGCPVVVSNTSSLPEVAGDAALYFDPDNTDSIRSALEKIVYNSSIAQELKSKGYIQLKNFSWEKCAKDTKKVYEFIL